MNILSEQTQGGSGPVSACPLWAGLSPLTVLVLVFGADLFPSTTGRAPARSFSEL